MHTSTHLQSAWGTMGRAKTALRRAEQRLHDAERRDAIDADNAMMGQPAEVKVDRVPSYSIGSSAARHCEVPVTVDNAGRSSYMKSQSAASNRKVSRMEDKYVESDWRARSPLRESNKDCVMTLRDVPQRDRHHRPTNTLPQSKYPAGGVIVSADSRDVRETDIRFLNDNVNGVGGGGSHRKRRPEPTRTTRVDVQRAVTAGGSAQMTNGHVDNTNTTYTLTASHDKALGKKMQRNLRNMQHDSDGLSKLKEMIRQQRKNVSPRDEAVPAEPTQPAEEAVFGTRDQARHHDEEPLHAKSYPLYDADRPAVAVRKVATAPPTPSYKGFSEPETRYKMAGGKIIKLSDMPQHAKKDRGAVYKQSNISKAADKNSTKKQITRVVAEKTIKPSKYNRKDIISTSSWRAGQKLILKQLGPNPARHHPTQPLSPPTRDREDYAETHSEADSESGSNQTCSKAKAPAVVAEKKDVASDIKKTSALSQEAKSVLADLLVDKSDSEADVKSEKEQKVEPKTPTRRKRIQKKDSTEREERGGVVKVRHYDADAVRRYMNKQRATRRQRQLEETAAQQQAAESRREQLRQLAARRSVTAKQTHSKADGNNKVESGSSDKENHHSSDCSSDSLSFCNVDTTPRLVNARHDADIRPMTRPSDPKMDELDALISKYASQPAGVQAPDMVTARQIVSRCKQQAGLQDLLSKAAQVQNTRQPAVDHKPQHATVAYDRGALGGHAAGTQGSAPSTSGTLSHAQRVQNIRGAATALSQRLHEEASRIVSDPLLNWEGTAERWAEAVYPAVPATAADRRGTEPARSAAVPHVGRYERITAAADNYNVFTGEMPGVNKLEAVRIEQEMARRDMGLPINEHATTHDKQLFAGELFDASRLSDHSSTFRDVAAASAPVPSVTAQTAIGSSLSQSAYCASRRKPMSTPIVVRSAPMVKSAPVMAAGLQVAPVKRLYSDWDTPVADSYSTMNVFANRQRNATIRADREKAATPLVTDVLPHGSADNMDALRTASYADDFVSSSHAASRTANKTAADTDTASISDANELSDSKDDNKSDADDTLEATLTPSMDSEDSRLDELPSSAALVVRTGSAPGLLSGSKPAAAAVVAVVTTTTTSGSTTGELSLSVAISSKGVLPRDAADVSTVSSLADQPAVSSYAQDTHGVQMGLSPASLEQRFCLELGRLDGVEESLRQLTDVERSRAVCLAQQETVSLSQILKSQRQEQLRDLAELKQRTYQESVETSRELEALRRQAAQHKAQQQAAAERVHEDHSTQYSQRGDRSGVQGDQATQYSQQSGYRQCASDPSRSTGALTDSAHSSSSSGSSPSKQHASISRRTSPSVAADTSIHTASDLSRQSVTVADIQTQLSGSLTDVASRTDSVPEELPSNSKDYSMEFDTSITEEEMERSLREVLPSESQCMKVKRESTGHAEDNTFSSLEDFQLPPMPSSSSSRRLSFEEESFSRFTMDMVRQYMREEEIRAQHQSSLLKLRERALMEKTKTELSWLEQQKQWMRNKGADDAYPQIKKRKRALVLKLHHEQAKIKRMHEANKAASQERRLLLLQSQEIAKLRQSTQQVREKIKSNQTPSINKVPAVDVSSENGSRHKKSDSGGSSSPLKSYKSDSELYTESRSDLVRSSSPADGRIAQKLSKMKMDQKYLTIREQRLVHRRRNAEELMAWKKWLDEEEMQVEKMEKEALSSWQHKKRRSAPSATTAGSNSSRVKEAEKVPSVTDASSEVSAEITAGQTGVTASVGTAAQPVDTPRTDGATTARSISEHVPSEVTTAMTAAITSAYDEHDGRSVTEEIATASAIKGKKSTDDVSTAHSSVDNEYASETFESATPRDVATVSVVKPASPQARTEKVSPHVGKTAGGKKASESESEDSFSITYSETPSDQSDVEGRIHMLNEDLRLRRLQAEQLKREQKKRSREKLKAQEAALKKQIEAYNSYINQVQTELQHDAEPDLSASVRPQIKQPCVAEPRRRRQGHLVATGLIDSEGSRPSVDEVPSPESAAPTASPISECHHDGQQTPSPLRVDTDEKWENKTSTPEQVVSEGKPCTDVEQSTNDHRTSDFVQPQVVEEVTTLPDTHSASEIQDALSVSEVRDLHSASEIRDVHSAKDICDVHSVSEVHDVHSAKNSIDIHSTSKVRDVHSASEVRSVSEIAEESSLRTASDVRSARVTLRSQLADESSKSHVKSVDDSEPLTRSEGGGSYSEDFSGASSPSSRRVDRKSTEHNSRSVETDSVDTEEDISEKFSLDDHDESQQESDGDEVLNLKLADVCVPEVTLTVTPEGKPEVRSEGKPEVTPAMKASTEVSLAPDEVEWVSNEAVAEVTTKVVETSVTAESVETAESELERVISSAAAAVEQFEHVTSAEVENEKPAVSPQRSADRSEKCEAVANNLMNEAISDMLRIRQQKNTATEEEEEEKRSEDKMSDALQLPLQPALLPPTTNSITKVDELEQLYQDMEALTATEDDDWMDDDFGLGAKPAVAAYPVDNSAKNAAVLSRQDLRLDLQRLTDELFFVVPHREASVRQLACQAVDVLWDRRRCGESWHGVRPPPDYLSCGIATSGATTDGPTDVECKSTQAYRSLVFDLSAEILQEMYNTGDEGEEENTCAVQRKRKRWHKYQPDSRQVPRTAAEVKPLVEKHVLSCLGLAGETPPTGGRWGGMVGGARKQKDHVDRLLVRELREEEADWLDYDADEMAVKLQLADNIFESLLADTCRAVSGLRRRAT